MSIVDLQVTAELSKSKPRVSTVKHKIIIIHSYSFVTNVNIFPMTRLDVSNEKMCSCLTRFTFRLMKTILHGELTLANTNANV